MKWNGKKKWVFLKKKKKKYKTIKNFFYRKIFLSKNKFDKKNIR